MALLKIFASSTDDPASLPAVAEGNVIFIRKSSTDLDIIYDFVGNVRRRISTFSKLDKVTGTTTNKQAYTKDANGTQSMTDAVSTATNNALMLRDANGRCRVESPNNDNDCANQGWTNTRISTEITTVLGNINTILNSIVNPT